MQKTKLSLLAVYELLKQFTDEDHILSRRQLCELLETVYQISIERRTFTDYISTLIEFGIDISRYEDNGIGYYLIDREFEKSEIHLLCNAVYASHFIPDKDSKTLIKKLLGTQSKYIAKNFNDEIYVHNFNKTVNKEFFYNVDILLDAIRNDTCVAFSYMKYNLDKKQVPRKDHLYIIHPYYIIYANENYYLICMNDAYDNLSHYRIDKMKNITIINQPRKKLVKSFDPYDYAKSRIYMYGGKEERVVLKCSNSILDDIIDRFGLQVKLQKCDDNYFFAILKASEQGMIFFAMQYLKYCEVIEPVQLRLELTNILKTALSFTYNDEV